MNATRNPLLARTWTFASPRLVGIHPESGLSLRRHSMACVSLAMREYADEELGAAALLVHLVDTPQQREEAASIAPVSAELVASLPTLRCLPRLLNTGRSYRFAESAAPPRVQQLLLIETRILARSMTRGIQAGRSFWASLPCCPWITMVEVRRILDGFMGEIPWVLLEEIQKQLWQVEKALRRFGADLILAAAQALGGTEALARYLGQRGGGGSFTLALQDDLWAIRLEATPVEPLGKLHLAPMPHGNGLDDKPLHLDPIAAEDPWLPAKLDVLCAQWEILQVLMREGGQW